MIRNERQYRVSKAQADRFERALEALRGKESAPGVHPKIREAQVRAVEGELRDLRRQVSEYEALTAGAHDTLRCRSLDELPDLLVKARIAKGLTQRDLAGRLSLKEQQIQRYEASNYAGASFTRLLDVVKALGLEIPSEVRIGAAEVTLPVLLGKLTAVGLDKDFVRRRILPASMSTPQGRPDGEVAAATAANRISRIFRWSPDELLAAGPLRVDARPLAEALFKLPGRVNEAKLAAYTVYAHYLSLLVLQASPVRRDALLTDPKAVRKALLAKGAVTLESALRYVWDLGVAVLPLSDRGSFHGAMWRAGGRNVIVLKQGTRSLARWLFDLLHEYRHAADEPDEVDRTVLEGDDVSKMTETPEQVASQFAGDVLLDCRSEELARLCVERAEGSVERLKRAVRGVAVDEGVDVEALANYVAYRLSLQGINWWGAAINLQSRGDDPWRVARDVLLERVDLAKLPEQDRELLMLALVGDRGSV
jgi:transcriptional regulator with XRE-family HTH domain